MLQVLLGLQAQRGPLDQALEQQGLQAQRVLLEQPVTQELRVQVLQVQQVVQEQRGLLGQVLRVPLAIQGQLEQPGLRDRQVLPEQPEQQVLLGQPDQQGQLEQPVQRVWVLRGQLGLQGQRDQ